MTDFWQGGFQPVAGAEPYELPKQDESLPRKPKKRIIICCDGTWQSSAHGNQTIPSNVAKISRSLANWYVDGNGLAAPQLIYYDAGVGTAMGWLDKKWAGGFGEGLDENVCEAYNFIVNNYSPGDELFFFGFSRGAYTVRACAGLVCRVGICRPNAMNQFWEMYANYKSIGPDDSMEESLWGKFWNWGRQESYTLKGQNEDNAPQQTTEQKDPKNESYLGQLWNKGRELYTVTVKGEEKKFIKGNGHYWLKQAQRNVTIKVVGVWDTVGSLGYPANVWRDVSAANKPYGFHNTDIHPQIENAFHALALEEHRVSFGPTLWSLPPGSNTNLIQCWFPGVHINVGGGSGDGLEKDSKGDLEIMSITTFCWMVDRCNPFLRFDIDYNIVKDYREALDTMTRKSLEAKDNSGKSYSGWGIGPVVDSFEGMMVAAGSEPRTPGHYFVDKHDLEHEHQHTTTNEFMHPVVWHARERNQYNVVALQGFERISLGPGLGHHWVKKYSPAAPGLVKRGWSYLFGSAVQSQTEEDIVSIPEFIIPLGGKNALGQEWVPEERKLATLESYQNQGYFPPGDESQRKVLYRDNEGARFLEKIDQDNAATEEIHAWTASKLSCTNPEYPVNWSF